MAKNKTLWIVVADGARARFFTLDHERPGLATAGIPDLVSAEVHGHERDLKSDHPGRSFASARSGVRHAIEPRHDFHKSEKHKFSAELAEFLEHARRKRQFEALVLVAPRRSLGELRGLLSEGVRASLRDEVPKDLTKHSLAGLWRQLSPVIRGPGATGA
jgi:protein required for attachment to host cells